MNFTFYETFKDEPIPHKNFTFLGQGSYEITGGGRPSPPPPLVSDVVPKPLVSEGLKSKQNKRHFKHFPTKRNVDPNNKLQRLVLFA